MYTLPLQVQDLAQHMALDQQPPDVGLQQKEPLETSIPLLAASPQYSSNNWPVHLPICEQRTIFSLPSEPE